MPAREDFGKMAARLLTDPRTHRAAELYVEASLAPEASAVALVCAHVSMLGLRLQLDRGTGRIPGDGVAFVAVACMTTPTSARKVLQALAANAVGEDHAYLVPEGDGLRLAGFDNQYGVLMERRAAAAVRARRSRGVRGEDSRGGGGGHANGARDPRAEEREVEENPPPPSPAPTGAGGDGLPAGKDGDGTPHPPHPWDAVVAALRERHQVDLAARPYRGGVSAATWRRHAEPLLATGLSPGQVADGIARASPAATPLEALAGLRKEARRPPPPRPRPPSAEETRRLEQVRESYATVLPFVEARGVAGERLRAWSHAWPPAVHGALAEGATPEAIADAIVAAAARNLDWMRPGEVLGEFLRGAATAARPAAGGA